ncbi:PqqD family protein [Haloimpatiens massiliensis]|uniref:PqqD family protein n=1 Tax=Haloimpatiens massiliensis TaxID=1658110 RepID=UPI000C844DFE|nr:PqqD family protein [Haloimpatiens massiliensis]
MKKFDENKNVLLMIPQRKVNIEWEKNGEIITLIIKREKYIDKIMHKIFKTPKVIRIELDQIGTFVWENCDGIKNINDISKQMKSHFGQKIEPVLERLITYIRTLKNNNFIELQ